MKYKNVMVLIILLISSSFIVTAKEISVVPQTDSINLVLTLNEDGSISSEVELLESLEYTSESNISDVVTLAYQISQNKKVGDLEIVDLNDPLLKPFARTTQLNPPNCSNEYILDLSNNKLTVCAKVKNKRELHHLIKYKYLQELNCIENDRVRQDIPIVLHQEGKPYSVRVTLKANDMINYLAPKDCPPSWTKSTTNNGIICINDAFTITEKDKNVQITFPMTGQVKSITEQNDLRKQAYKEIISKVVTLILGILAIIGFRDYLKEQWKTRKVMFVILTLIVVVAYVIFLLW